MKNKPVILLATSAAVLLLTQPTSAAGNDKKEKTNEVVGTWSNVNPFPELKQSDYLIENKAWEVDLQGNKKEVPLANFPSKDGIGAEMWSDSTYDYYYDHYEPWANSKDLFHFSVGSVTYRNESNNAQSMSYTQQVTTTSTWTTTGKVNIEASLGLELLANAKFNAGFDVQKTTTTSQGSTWTGLANVSPRSQGTLACYDAGESSSGAGVWKKYTKSGTLVGTYNETTGAWTVATNNKSFKYSEYGI
ncbi:MAG: hypothetical protein WCC10_07515 [Tumebacillaceae bacterium]